MLSALENIYISPLELCNLNCRLCYTKKSKNILTNPQILSFVKRYKKYLSTLPPVKGSSGLAERDLSLKSILFCGGEVFTLNNFPRLVNKLISQNIFITIITNGTIDSLKSIKNPTNCQLLVSLDGPKEVHDTNRGSGNFDKTIKFIDHALFLNFPVEIMYLVTPESYPFIDSFKIKNLKINYLTQKTYFYTNNHPLSNQKNTKPALTPKQIVNIKQNYPSIPAKNFGCFQLSLQSNGQIYGCCESPHSLAKISDPMKKIVKNFIDSLSTCQSCKIWSSVVCHGCCAPDFLCGYKQELNLIKCQQVTTIFNKK